MERFWRTLRQGCLDHIGTMTQLHDVQARLLAFLDEHYHRAPHGGLFGKHPAEVWDGAVTRTVDEPTLAAALTTRARRRVRRDGTLDIDGTAWQLDQSFLAGALVTVAIDMTGGAAPIVEHDDRRYTLHSRGRRRRRQDPAQAARQATYAQDCVRSTRCVARQTRRTHAAASRWRRGVVT